MHRLLASRRSFSPMLAILATASSFAACAPWELGEDEPPQVDDPSSVAIAAEPPPAISGGTLAVSKSAARAVAADPDRDRVWVVDLEGQRLLAEIALEKGDEPGRVVEDGAGRFHVALRRGGAVVTIDADSGKIVGRRAVCAAPRGIAYDARTDALHVACLGGELMTLPAARGAATRHLQLDRDLRDVVVDGDRLLVSKFRSTELLTVSADGSVAERQKLPHFNLFGQEFAPTVAWRTVGLPSGGVAVVHQRALVAPVEVVEGGYSSGGCDGSIVHSTVTEVGAAGSTERPRISPAFPSATLPVDLAVSADGMSYAVVAAGRSEVLITTSTMLNANALMDFGDGAGFNNGEGTCIDAEQRVAVDGEPTAVAFAGNAVIVQTREPAAIHVLGTPGISSNRVITLPGESRRDTGHEMFHRNASGPMACASCHPEGGEDGHTWVFNPIGPRRTQFMSGGILNTAPFHWDGDMSGIEAIMDEVFERRMGGVHQGPRRVNLFARWIDSLPAPPVSLVPDQNAVARGEALFHDKAVDCARCHAGAQLTNNQSFDVGTGKAFQVPSLVRIGARAPFMHNGCAATLRDRFTDTTCGGGDLHGKTSHLDADQIDDLIAYLETL
ncbi:cytochrome-c peroxidase [Sorangium cellulosum]|uniref:Cytochrome-c peroxidase n=1 Tax=Sorangium cellulosum TaxID=56 RepID=A0A150T1E9_SORCE|nr:cytochrome-c peroxidase [Sorangium cellulosum]KYF98541.1 cytochrome-c peroxidase [Sorangium cellulosum]